MKKTFKILHLYHDLMNLYGSWANAAVLEHELVKHGHKAEIHKKSVGDEIVFDSCDFIFLGSGTERSQLACLRDLSKYKDALIEQIEAGIPMLATGNSHELFGQTITDAAGVCHKTLGLLNFDTIQKNTRVTGDCVYMDSFTPNHNQELQTGFINRAGGCQTGDIKRPFNITPRDGASLKDKLSNHNVGGSASRAISCDASEEGIMYKNLLGTYMTGPILIGNKNLLKHFAEIMIKKSIS